MTAAADGPVPAAGRTGRWAWAILLAMFAGLAGVAAVWLAVDRHPFEWDYAGHLERALGCHRILSGADPGGVRQIMEGPETFYPPLVFCAAGLLYLVLPPTAAVAQVVVVAALGVAMAGVFALARYLTDPATGLLAAFILGTAPFAIYSMLNFQLDLPLTAMVALSLLCLVRADDFGRPGWSLAFGAVCGLALLTKPSFPIYVGAPAAWAALRAMRRPNRRRLLWLAAALGLALAVAIPWYGPRLLSIPAQAVGRSFQNAAREGQPPTLTSTSLTFYPRTLPSQLGWLATAAFAGGLWAIRRRPRTRMILWLAALVPAIAFTGIQNKNLRYTLPILPAAAVIGALGVRALPLAQRRLAMLAVVALGGLQVSMSAFGVPDPSSIWPSAPPLAISYPPVRDDWQHDRILADLARASEGRPATLAIVPNHAYFSRSNFAYEVAQRGWPVRVVRLAGEVPRGVDFIVTKTGLQGPDFSGARPPASAAALADSTSWLARIYPVIGEYPLPDGSRAALRARRIAPRPDVPPETLARRLEAQAARVLDDYIGAAEGLRVRAKYRPEAIQRGEVDALTVEAARARVGELSRPDHPALRVRDLRVVLSGLVVDPVQVMGEGNVDVLDLRGLHVERLTITEDDLDAYLAARRRSGRVRVSFDDGWARATVRGLGPTIEGRLRLRPGEADAPVRLVLDEVRVGGLGVPDGLVSWVARHFDPTPRLRKLPLAIALAPIALRPGRLEVGGSAALRGPGPS